MSRRSLISAERQKTNFESISNLNTGVVITGTILDVCGAHNPITDYIQIIVDKNGIPTEGFYGSGINFIIFDHTNKEIVRSKWKGTIYELITVYGNDNNIKGRRVTLHCLQNNKDSIENSTIRWEREDDILLENENTYISLAGVSGITVSDWESQMKAFLENGVGIGRRWNRP